MHYIATKEDIRNIEKWILKGLLGVVFTGIVLLINIALLWFIRFS